MAAVDYSTSLNDLNLPPNPFNILAKMAVAHSTAEGHDANYSTNHRSRRNCHRYWRPWWTWAQLRDGRHHTLRPMTIHSTPMINPGEFFSTLQRFPPSRHLASWKENWASECPSQKKAVSQHVWEALWTVAPRTEKHPRLVVNKLKTRDWKLIYR